MSDFPGDWRIETIGDACEIHDSKRFPLSSGDMTNLVMQDSEVYIRRDRDEGIRIAQVCA